MIILRSFFKFYTTRAKKSLLLVTTASLLAGGHYEIKYSFYIYNSIINIRIYLIKTGSRILISKTLSFLFCMVPPFGLRETRYYEI